MANLAPLRAIRSRFSSELSRLRESATVDPDANHAGNGYYRRVTGSGTLRDLQDGQRASSVERAFNFADLHPLANRYLTLMSEWIRPSEFRPTALDPIVEKVVRKFWEDPRNDWEWTLPRVNEVKLAVGEVSMPAKLDPYDGAVVLDYFDPADIIDARFLSEGDVRISNRVISSVRMRLAVGETVLPVVTPIRISTDPAFGRLCGRRPHEILPPGADPLYGISGVIYRRFNCRVNSERGRSDFLSSMDGWLALDDVHAALIERFQTSSRIMGDIEITDGKINEAMERYRALPQYASIAIHSSGEKHTYHAPTLNSSDSSEAERTARVYYSASTGIAPHVLSGDMTEGNRSVATSTMDPSYLRAQSKSDELAGLVKFMCRYAVDTAWLRDPAAFRGVSDWSIDVERPNVFRKTPEELAPFVANIAQLCLTAVQGSLLDRQTARELLVRSLGELGLADVKLEDVEDRLRQQTDTLDAETRANLAGLAKELDGPGEPQEVGQPVDAPPAATVPDLKIGIVSGAVDIVVKTQAGELPRESAVELLVTLFRLTPEEADRIVGPAGRGLELPKPAAEQVTA